MQHTPPMLEVKQIDTFYGEAHVLHGISLQVEQGEAVAILGRNGAGKTTLLRSILGLTPARAGSIYFRGQDITRMPTNEIANLGLGWVPDNRRIFPTLTVRQNLEIARKPGSDGKVHWDLERIYKHFPDLEKLTRLKGENLSGGQQQMLSIARTLMGNPSLVLLDEPSEGLAPLIVREVMNIIQELVNSNITTVLVEQNSRLALRICSRVYVLDDGRNAYQGSAQQLRDDPERIQQLLGV